MLFFKAAVISFHALRETVTARQGFCAATPNREYFCPCSNCSHLGDDNNTLPISLRKYDFYKSRALRERNHATACNSYAMLHFMHECSLHGRIFTLYTCKVWDPENSARYFERISCFHSFICTRLHLNNADFRRSSVPVLHNWMS